MPRNRKNAIQLELPTARGWGGKRKGAGRKRAAPRKSTAHRIRPRHCDRHPVHVTMRATSGSKLRERKIFLEIVNAIEAAQKSGFQIAHFSVQQDHVHLIVEATSTEDLSRGMRGLSVRMARAINRARGTTGRVWSDRWHGRALTTPREVRNALAYVIFNAQKHGVRPVGLDPHASIYWDPTLIDHASFQRPGPPTAPRRPPVRPARTWLLGRGWRRGGALSLADSARMAANATSRPVF